jgi:hypothetical protein
MAASKAYQWVSNGKAKPHVFEAVQDDKAKRALRTEITADMVIQEIAKIGFASMTRFITIEADGQPRLSLLSTMPDDLDAISEVTTETVIERSGNDKTENQRLNTIRKTKIKLHDKLAALEKLARHIGIYDKTTDSSMNSLAQAIIDIQSRTSRAPIRCDPVVDIECGLHQSSSSGECTTSANCRVSKRILRRQASQAPDLGRLRSVSTLIEWRRGSRR